MSRYVDIEPYEDCRIVLHDEDKGIRCRDLPAVDVEEVRHGEWINTGAYVCGEYEFECTECGYTNWHTSEANEKYCPGCGARMDGDEE